jgi:hypothetical protein
LVSLMFGLLSGAGVFFLSKIITKDISIHVFRFAGLGSLVGVIVGFCLVYPMRRSVK